MAAQSCIIFAKLAKPVNDLRECGTSRLNALSSSRNGWDRLRRPWMRRMALVLLLMALPSLSCALSESPTAVPTPLPAPILQNPVVGVTPISGVPGTLINVVVAGFPVGSRVNIYVSTLDTTNANPAAQDLTIGAGGILIFSMQVPDQVGGKTLTGTTPISFT